MSSELKAKASVPLDLAAPAISCTGVSKCYQVYVRPEDRLKQSLLPRVQRVAGQPVRRYYNEFWALRDVGFQVARGETVGIIGRNGSGKSTLLQIVCGTLSPTAGSVEVNGRVAALLELGSGFNPEFTGRENVFLNGSVLGLSREQIAARFDDIARFADIGDFIDQPVKTYSSGMAVRLAFAVIAHVDADILVIDEALSVGDAVFSQKCMRFLRRFKESGTVLFVSHDAASIASLCSHAVWLDQGQIQMAGNAKDVADAYARFCAKAILGDSHQVVALNESEKKRDDPDPPAESETRISFFQNIINSDGWATGQAQINAVDFLRSDGDESAVFAGGERVTLIVRARIAESIQRPIIGFLVKDRLGQSLFGENTFNPLRQTEGAMGGGEVEARFRFVLPMLPNGDYSMTVALADGDLEDHIQHHWIHDAIIIKVVCPKPRYGLVGIPFESITFDRTPG